MSDEKRTKFANALAESDRELAFRCREGFEQKKVYEELAAEQGDKAKAMTEGLLDLLRVDKIVFEDGYYLVKQSEVRVSYAANKLQESMLAAGIGADEIKQILAKSANETPVNKVFGKAPKAQ